MSDEPLRPGVNTKHGERFLRGDDLEPVLRDPLALTMFAAWLGVRVDQIPTTPAMRAHTCADTMARYKAMGEAARSYFMEHGLTAREPRL